MLAIRRSDLANTRFNRIGDGEQGEEAAHGKSFLHNVTHADQNHLALRGAETFAGQQDNAQTCGTDVIEIGKIEDQTLGARCQAFRQHSFKLWGIGTVQAADRTHDDDIVDGLNFKFHDGTWYPVTRCARDCKGKQNK